MLRLLHKLGIQSETTSSKELKKDFKDIDFAKLLTEYREWVKKITSFGKNFIDKINQKTHRLHSEFHQGGTATGRYASFNPDLQNIPKNSEYRNCFIAPDGWDMLSGDYTQIELVLAAEISQDPTMVRAMRDGISLHGITASSIHGGIPVDQLTVEQYTKGKSMNFAMLYGSSPRGIAYNFSVSDDEAKKYIETFNNTYPILATFMKAVHQKIIELGYSSTLLGRKRWFIIPAQWTQKDWKYLYRIYREGFNHVIQGSSADITKLAMCNIYYDNPFGKSLKLIMTVHDEIILLAKKDISKDAAEFVRNQMILAAKTFIKTLPVDVKVTTASCWTKE
jgi:DNA polymerase I-like protein with 3'-5' exonuclease and polymerase domains